MRGSSFVLLAVLSVLLPGCELAGGIFKGGFIIGIIVAVIVVWLLIRLFSGRGRAP